MIFFLSHALITSNNASMYQNIFLMMIKKHVFIRENVSYKVIKQLTFYSSITSADNADTGGEVQS